ncbi:helix-turn-helix transcriptional regulator [Pedosphaera parvula]|uniref:helix-turn-helix transcriptional regulator n=1 Tax=Pedosphaera parvula TaxID=1032527 RepID=UPI00135F1170|nr:AraC family transcriptional regulator [Pedosphaera parvula]
MTAEPPIEVRRRAGKSGRKAGFTEAGVWETVGGGWRQLHGNFSDLGFSVEWHDFQTTRNLDWSRSFHPGSIEICLNILGNGEVKTQKRELILGPSTGGFYFQTLPRLSALRNGGERHQFITIELAPVFLRQYLAASDEGLHPRLKSFLGGKNISEVSEPIHLESEQQQMVASLQHPPVHVGGRRLWYQAKALEIAAAVLYQPVLREELFCDRQKRLSQERVQKVIAILKENLSEPPPLEEIGRRVGCSHFYLSRIFTQAMGKTISAQLRDLRMERAAALLRDGRMNVTEVALEVGYSSLSHFSTAFHQEFGCCPGLYPMATIVQRNAKSLRS